MSEKEKKGDQSVYPLVYADIRDGSGELYCDSTGTTMKEDYFKDILCALLSNPKVTNAFNTSEANKGTVKQAMEFTNLALKELESDK